MNCLNRSEVVYKNYDLIIVGAGLYGSTFARVCTDAGKKVLVIDERKHIGGNCYDEKIKGITVQKYGAHIFHTSDESIWSFVNRFTNFVPFINKVKAVYKNKEYSLPFNMNTFYELWGITSAEMAKFKIEQEKVKNENPKNLEEQALSLVGKTIYETLIKGYTEKQWMRKCTELPPEIIMRLPLRFEYNNNYFNDIYQGIPINGYTSMIEKMLNDIDIVLNTKITHIPDDIFTVYTGRIDELFNYRFGKLEYRSVKFKNRILHKEYFQDRAVVNYTDKKVPYTRIIEHKYFLNEQTKNTYISYEIPEKYTKSSIPAYSINNKINNELYQQYLELANQYNNLLVSGRLGKYKYLDMDDVISLAIDEANKYLRGEI